MAWVETQPGHWQRPIGENEAMIKMIGDKGGEFGKDVWSISVTASFVTNIKSKSLSEALRDGWKILRFFHPSIATTASEETLDYHTPSSTELEQWIEESFILVDDDSTCNDVIARLTPSRYATLYYLRGRSSILLNLSHWRTDGIGAFHLLNAYFQVVLDCSQRKPFQLRWGSEATRLVPSVEEALELPLTPSPAIELATKEYLATLANNLGSLETMYKSESGIGPKGTRGARLIFSHETTIKLENACYRSCIHLEAAVHAAVTATAYSIANSASRHKHHSSTMRCSIRPYLPTPYNSEAGAAGLYTAGYVTKVPANQSWLQNAKQYDDEYKRGATPDLLCSRRQYALAMKEILKKVLPPDPPLSGLDVSYVPMLVKPVYAGPEYHIEVRSVGIGVDVVSRQLYVFVWIFNGQLECRLVYNESFYEESFVQGVLALLKDHLISNLLSSNE